MMSITTAFQMSNQNTDLLILLFCSMSHYLDTSESVLLSAILDPPTKLPVLREKDYPLLIGPVRQNNAVRTILRYVRRYMTFRNLHQIIAARAIQRRVRKICCAKIFRPCCRTIATCVIQQRFRRSKILRTCCRTNAAYVIQQRFRSSKILDRCHKILASYVITRCVQEVCRVKQIQRCGLLFDVSFEAVYDGFWALILQLERIDKIWAQLEHSQLAHALNVEDSSLPDLCAEAIVLNSFDIPLVPKAQGSDSSLSQDLDLAKRSPKDGSLTPLSSDKASTISIVDDSSSTTFEDVSSTPPDDGGVFDVRGITNLSSDEASNISIVVESTSTDLCAEESIGHYDSIKVKRLDKPKVKCAPGSNLVKLPLKDDSLTPLDIHDLFDKLMAKLEEGKLILARINTNAKTRMTFDENIWCLVTFICYLNFSVIEELLSLTALGLDIWLGPITW